MPTADIVLPLTDHPLSVRLDYLDRGGTSDIGYLQRVRSMAKLPPDRLQDMAQRYHALRASWTVKLAALVDEPVSALVSPPSSRPELITPYRLALSSKFPSAVDLTGRFLRTGDIRAGEGASVDELLAATSYTVGGDETGFGTIVVVDDVVAEGNSAAVVIALLRAAGLPEAGNVRVAAPLWLG